jgi:hypothetical protein
MTFPIVPKAPVPMSSAWLSSPANRLHAKGEEREVADDEACPAPRDANDGDVGDDPRQPPRQSHENSTEDEPQEIENRAHDSG